MLKKKIKDLFTNDNSNDNSNDNECDYGDIVFIVIGILIFFIILFLFQNVLYYYNKNYLDKKVFVKRYIILFVHSITIFLAISLSIIFTTFIKNLICGDSNDDENDDTYYISSGISSIIFLFLYLYFFLLFKKNKFEGTPEEEQSRRQEGYKYIYCYPK